MYEKELEKAQERLNAALTLAKKQPQESINMIVDMQKWIDETLPNDIVEYYGVTITYNEAIGDLYLSMRRFPDAEVAYKKMVSVAVKLYEVDKEKYDFRLAVAYCKLANNCATNIGMQNLLQGKRELEERMKRPFEAGENFFKVAIKMVEDNCKKGSARHLEIRARTINSLATMEANVGHYKEALAMFSDSVRILKAIYQTMDNLVYGVMLGETLLNQGAVYTMNGEHAKAQECLEDSIYVLKEHEDEDAVRSGIMIARNYMNLGASMLFQQADLDEVDVIYDKATSKISMVNAIAKGSAITDEISCYMLSGQYFKVSGREEKAVQQLEHAMKLVNGALAQAPDSAQFQNMKKHIEVVMNMKAEQ